MTRRRERIVIDCETRGAYSTDIGYVTIVSARGDWFVPKSVIVSREELPPPLPPEPPIGSVVLVGDVAWQRWGSRWFTSPAATLRPCLTWEQLSEAFSLTVIHEASK